MDELRSLIDGQRFDLGEVTSRSLCLFLPPGGVRPSVARLMVAEHLAAEVRALPHLSAGEVLSFLPRLVRPSARLGYARVGVGLALRHCGGPRLDAVGGLRQAAPAPPGSRLSGAVLARGRGQGVCGAALAEPAHGAMGVRCCPHPIPCGEVGGAVCCGLLDERGGDLGAYSLGGCEDGSLLVGLGLVLPLLVVERGCGARARRVLGQCGRNDRGSAGWWRRRRE
ncbi:hypothetical protein [Aeromicrobium sp.]|uniref:hypothetical protein n=1 Tax=Aeromicrobium sp. TaxID=1871063 RepID=UPI0025C6C314|nr:hypothetical protein [Aeromicrobium sp.]